MAGHRSLRACPHSSASRSGPHQVRRQGRLPPELSDRWLKDFWMNTPRLLIQRRRRCHNRSSERAQAHRARCARRMDSCGTHRLPAHGDCLHALQQRTHYELMARALLRVGGAVGSGDLNRPRGPASITHHPFVAPAAMPSMMWRCAQAKITSGTIAWKRELLCPHDGQMAPSGKRSGIRNQRRSRRSK